MPDGSHTVVPEELNWLNLVAETLPGVFWSTDTALRIHTCQGMSIQRLAVHGGTLCGTSLFELFGTEDLTFPPLEAHRRALQGARSPISFTLGGTTYRGLVAPLQCADHMIGCATVVFDLSFLGAHCEAIARTTADLILFLRPDGTIEEINRAARGMPREHVIGRSVFDFTPAGEHPRLREAMHRVLETGHCATLEMRFARRFDDPAWQTMRIGPLVSMGEATGLVLLATDITPYKHALQELEAKEVLLRNLLELQDRERRLVAYEIHDGFIQDVVGARMVVQGVRDAAGQLDPVLQRQLDTSVSLMARAIRDGRRLISELRPMIIDEMGIKEAVEYLISEEESEGDLEITFTHRLEVERLPPLLQATIFRIIREAVTNARRHGRASWVEIRLTQIGQQHLIIEIQDNGMGFDIRQVPKGHFGLAGIRERAQLFGGGASIESAPGHGTRITVKVALGTPARIPRSEQPSWTWTV